METQEDRSVQKKREEVVDELEKNYDFVRFVWSDILGIARGKLAPVRHAKTFIQHGISTYHGIQAGGPRAQVVVFDEVTNWFGNSSLVSDLDTLCLLPWAASESKARIGQVLCESKDQETGDATPICPRSLARRLTDQLSSEFGLQLLSAFEHEYILLHKDTYLPVCDGSDLLSTLLLSKFENYFTMLDFNLRQVGVDIETIMAEYQQGQFEIATHPMLGLKGFDTSFLLKEFVKELSRESGFISTFLARPYVGEANSCCSGTHHNMSLWNMEGRNVFTDESDDNGMSGIFQHWLAGLVEHSPAITALCCPTVNCYRRMHKPWTPHDNKWGFDNRGALLRVRQTSHSGSFVELRLPSSAANPYLLGAGVLAAGMDGLRRQLEQPPEMDENAKILPHTLEDALNSLSADNIIVEAIGKKFVEVFCQAKRETEVDVLKDADIEVLNDENMVKERRMYLEYI